MNAIYMIRNATRGTTRGVVEAGFDAFGPYIGFTPGITGELEKLTSDDAMFADEFISGGMNIRKVFEKLNDGEWIFEAGEEVEYEGTYRVKHFRNFNDAEKYAESLGDEWSDRYIRPIQLF